MHKHLPNNGIENRYNPIERVRDSLVLERIANHKAKASGLDFEMLTCPEPISPSRCLLLIEPDPNKIHFKMKPYSSKQADDSSDKIITPNGFYAFVVIYNDKVDAVEFRCGSNENGANVHNNLSGYARFVECAGEMYFNNGVLVSWNLKSGSYKPNSDFAHRSLLNLKLLEQVNDQTNTPALVGNNQFSFYNKHQNPKINKIRHASLGVDNHCQPYRRPSL